MRRLIAVLVVCAAGAVGATACSHPQQTAASSAMAQEPAAASRQGVLPSTGLERPDDVEVDSSGNVYLTDVTQAKDSRSNRVIELAAGSKTQKTLPFTRSTLIAAPSGAVWVIDGRPSRPIRIAQTTSNSRTWSFRASADHTTVLQESAKAFAPVFG
jgi:streptogramin lyase